jgi:GR25 family glycosyltransferase involved in LPS biosynthesis
MMKTVCVTLTDRKYGKQSPHANHSQTHFSSIGLDVQNFYGIHAERIGVNSVVTSLVIGASDPNRTQSIGMMSTGCWLSHRALWAALLLLPDDEFLVIEDDARFQENWKARFDRALADVPTDWDMLYVGSCCVSSTRRLVRGEVYDNAMPQCTHAYCVRRKALMPLCELADEAGVRKPVDTFLVHHATSRLRIYTVLPRIADQYDAVLPEGDGGSGVFGSSAGFP